MSETILIPFIDPTSEVIQCLPFKLVINDHYIEVFARYEVITDDEEKGMKDRFDVDSIESISKESISGIICGKSVKHTDKFLIKILNPNSSEGQATFFFDSKQEAKELYTKLITWRYANS